MNNYKYDFSFIISVYNVKEFIKEALDSLVKQDYDMRRVQYILVDDGSIDGSGEYCDGFRIDHPDNTVVIHKENGGLSSARMAGIPYVEGKYVTFFDPDDILSPNTLKSVFTFFEAHEKETDVVAIPIYFFGDMEGSHPLNNKFAGGSRVIDLSDYRNARISQMSVATAFFTRSAVEMMNFDTEIVTAEDAIELVKILTEKQTLGVVADAKYHYRKRKTSTVGGAQYKKGWYLTYLEHFSEWAIHYCVEKLGYLPRFVQNTIMYDLQWKIRPQHIMKDVLSEQETAEYQRRLFAIAKCFDDDIILNQSSIYIEHKLFLLYQKYQRVPDVIRIMSNGKRYLSYQGCAFYSVEDIAAYVNFIRVKEESVEIEGSVMVFNNDWGAPEVVLRIGDDSIKAEEGNYKDVIYSADLPIASRKWFHAQVPIALIQNGVEVRIVSNYPQFTVEHQRVIFGKHAPITHHYYRSYYFKHNILIKPSKKGILIKRATPTIAAKQEIKYLLDLVGSKRIEARKAAVARLTYFVLKPFMPKNIWLITDKSDRADDNGEAFFRYLIEQKKQECTPVFAISKSSADYKHIKNMGRVVPYMSWRHKLLHLLAAHTVSAYSHNEITSPFLNYSYYYGDLLQNNKVVFLQHGIIKDDLSASLNRPHKNFALFVTSTERERNAVLTDNYGYSEDQVILTGLPRYDRLYDNRQKKITVMPTWLRSLFGDYNPKTSKWMLLPGFEKSEYYQFYSGLLNSQRLLDYADQKGYTIQFLAHPVLFPYLSHFKFDSRVVVLDAGVCYRDVFAESSLITTDYSSVAFDFAYLGKPVIYTQFESNHYAEGYFDYEEDGFGEVEHTLEGSIDRIIEYMDRDCEMKDKYYKRITKFYSFHDQKNCERVFEKIRMLDS